MGIVITNCSKDLLENMSSSVIEMQCGRVFVCPIDNMSVGQDV